MSDQPNGNHAPPISQVEPRAQLVISLLPDGTVQVAGPLAEPLACYGLLEAAKDSLRAYWATQAKPARLQIVRTPLPEGGY